MRNEGAPPHTDAERAEMRRLIDAATEAFDAVGLLVTEPHLNVRQRELLIRNIAQQKTNKKAWCRRVRERIQFLSDLRKRTEKANTQFIKDNAPEHVAKVLDVGTDQK